MSDVPFWQQPAERSTACMRLLERIEAGTWRPAESTLWRDPRDAAKRARVHEWEWRNLILHGYCARLADDPACAWPVERLPQCPTQVFEPYQDRDGTRYLQGLCVCPEPDTDLWPARYYARAHWTVRLWLADGPVALYCHCGGPEDPPGSGIRWVNGDGYVCESCAPLLATAQYPREGGARLERGRVGDGPSWSHRLKCDCRCCYCGGVAKAGRGWRLTCHPPLEPVTATPDPGPR